MGFRKLCSGEIYNLGPLQPHSGQLIACLVRPHKHREQLLFAPWNCKKSDTQGLQSPSFIFWGDWVHCLCFPCTASKQKYRQAIFFNLHFLVPFLQVLSPRPSFFCSLLFLSLTCYWFLAAIWSWFPSFNQGLCQQHWPLFIFSCGFDCLLLHLCLLFCDISKYLILVYITLVNTNYNFIEDSAFLSCFLSGKHRTKLFLSLQFESRQQKYTCLLLF